MRTTGILKACLIGGLIGICNPGLAATAKPPIFKLKIAGGATHETKNKYFEVNTTKGTNQAMVVAKAGKKSDSDDDDAKKLESGFAGPVKAEATHEDKEGNKSTTTSTANVTFWGTPIKEDDFVVGARVDALGNAESVVTGKKYPPGFASWKVNDPLVFERHTPGADAIFGAFFLGDEFLLEGTAPGGSGWLSIFARSDVVGYESLFDFTFGMLADDPANPLVEFSSNPLLGLDDAATEAALLGALNFDPIASAYALSSETLLTSFEIPVGEDVDRVAVRYDFEAEVRVPGIPLPASSLLLLTALGIPTIARRFRSGERC